MKKAVVKKFAKSTENHLESEARKGSKTKVFSYEFCKIFKGNFSIKHFCWFLLINLFVPNAPFLYPLKWVDMSILVSSSYLTSSNLLLLNFKWIWLTHLFAMHFFFTPWKHQKILHFLMFSGGREGVYWEQWVKSVSFSGTLI